jgi:hypothetical protein
MQPGLRRVSLEATARVVSDEEDLSYTMASMITFVNAVRRAQPISQASVGNAKNFSASINVATSGPEMR